MLFELNIRNIGNLENVDISIDRFTVLAGPNNSGKSFVSKTLYSVVSSLSEDVVERYFLNIARLVTRAYLYFESEIDFSFSESDSNPHPEIFDVLGDLENYVAGTRIRSKVEIETATSHFAQLMETITDLVGSAYPHDDRSKSKLRNCVHSIEEMKGWIIDQEASAIVERAISEELKRRFINNFQVPNFSHMQQSLSQPSVVNIDKIGEFNYFDGDFNSNVTKPWPASPHGFSTIVYLESPIYLKLMKVLDQPSFHFHYPLGMGECPRISGVPGYFLELADMLRFRRVGEMAFPDIYGKLVSDEIMGGRLQIANDGTIFFEDSGNDFPMPITALDITNIGVLALLIERKILNNESLLIVDEPEAHLHPAWQVVMAESLFELARNGVHVVISTNSPEILKWLQVHIKKHSEDKEFVALNQFPISNPSLSDSAEHLDFEGRLAGIMEELSRPYADLYVDGLLMN